MAENEEPREDMRDSPHISVHIKQENHPCFSDCHLHAEPRCERPAKVARRASKRSKLFPAPPDSCPTSALLPKVTVSIETMKDGWVTETAVATATAPVAPQRARRAEDALLPAHSMRAIALMRMWRKRGVSAGVVVGLDAPELAAMLASFMLDYRERVCDKFNRLQACLERFFDLNFVCGATLVGKYALTIDTVYPEIVKALDSEAEIGAKLGLKNALYRFFAELEETERI